MTSSWGISEIWWSTLTWITEGNWWHCVGVTIMVHANGQIKCRWTVVSDSLRRCLWLGVVVQSGQAPAPRGTIMRFSGWPLWETTLGLMWNILKWSFGIILKLTKNFSERGVNSLVQNQYFRFKTTYFLFCIQKGKIYFGILHTWTFFPRETMEMV